MGGWGCQRENSKMIGPRAEGRGRLWGAIAQVRSPATDCGQRSEAEDSGRGNLSRWQQGQSEVWTLGAPPVGGAGPNGDSSDGRR